MIDGLLEKATWGTNTGPAIAGRYGDSAPAKFGFNQGPESIEFYTVGAPYTDWLASTHRPYAANTGRLALSFDLLVDGRAMIEAQAMEFDTRLSFSKFNYNFSSQFNIQRGKWQIIKNGAWVDVAVVPKFKPYTWLSVKFEYAFNVSARKFSPLGVHVDSAFYEVPTALWDQDASSLNWVDSCNLQVQQDLGALGGQFSQFMRKIQYEWS